MFPILSLLLLLPLPSREAQSLSCTVKLTASTPSGIVHSGWAVPISPVAALTALHIVADETAYLRWIDQREGAEGAGDLQLIWKSEARDLAILHRAPDSAPFPCWVVRARRAPEIQDRVCWRGFLAGMLPTVACGDYLGVDGDHDMALDGWCHPGASGSPVVNAKGEALGIITKPFNWSDQWFEANPVSDISPIEQRLYLRTMFRGLTFASPVFGDKAPWEGK